MTSNAIVPPSLPVRIDQARNKALFDEIEVRLPDPIVVSATETVSMAACGVS